MLTVYFSGTGNTKYAAELFSGRMGGRCFSVEDDADFAAEIKACDTVAFCYPVYGSRVPLIMREFAVKHMDALQGKKLIVLVTQTIFSGDGARVLCDLFPTGHVEVVYAEHFFMPNNVCNFALLRRTGESKTRKYMRLAERRMDGVCRNVKLGIVKRRGFSVVSRLLGKIQGRPWQGDSGNVFAGKGTMEYQAKHSVRVDGDCTACNVCVECCPMQNLENRAGTIVHKNNCYTAA